LSLDSAKVTGICGHNDGIRVITSFSQDQLQKHYVTHEIRRHKEMVWRLLQQNAFIFISGSAKRMPADVREVIIEIIREYGDKEGRDNANKFLQQMEREKRYVVEAWSS